MEEKHKFKILLAAFLTLSKGGRESGGGRRSGK
jgi:hypothetical protein